MREMSKNHNSIVLFQLKPKFWWMLLVGVGANHTKCRNQQWRPGMAVASAGPPFQNLQFGAKISFFFPYIARSRPPLPWR